MPRFKMDTGLSLAQLEKLMSKRRDELADLNKERGKLQKQLDAIDSRIAQLSGGSFKSEGGGSRPRNELSLQDAIYEVLSKASGPLGVGEIMEKVLATGYRSSSANFRGIVNQTLIKDKRFTSTGRGVYQAKGK